MYLTGNFNNFHSRLHQFPTGAPDLINFRIEGSGYLSNWSASRKRKASKEMNKQYLTTLDVLNTGYYFG